MENMHKSNFTLILFILLIVALLAITIWLLYDDVTSTTSDYISGVGSVASFCAFLITLWQIKQVKTTSEATKKAVLAKTKEIEQLFTFANIERQMESCHYISICLKDNQYEAAALKMENLKGALVEIMINNWLPDVGSRHLQLLIKRTGNDIVAVRGLKDNHHNIEQILQHVDDVSTYLQKVSSLMKKEVYVKEV